jgi:hypothetical protein
LAGTGIQRNPEESRGIQGKYRNSCPTGIPAKKSCDSGKNWVFLRPPPKPRSREKFLRKTQEKKEILRNPGRNSFFGPKNKFLKTGICNLELLQVEFASILQVVAVIIGNAITSTVIVWLQKSITIPNSFMV